MAVFCQRCGTELEDENSICQKCEANKIEDTEIVSNNNINDNSKNNLAIAGFILSILSILCCGAISIVSLILSIIGYNKVKDENNSAKGFAIAGMIISSIMIITSIVFYILVFGLALLEEF